MRRALAAGTRLYRETPDSLLKAKTKKQQSEPQWELLASSPEQLTELGEKLRRSKKKPDQTLAVMVGRSFPPGPKLRAANRPCAKEPGIDRDVSTAGPRCLFHVVKK